MKPTIEEKAKLWVGLFHMALPRTPSGERASYLSDQFLRYGALEVCLALMEMSANLDNMLHDCLIEIREDEEMRRWGEDEECKTENTQNASTPTPQGSGRKR